MLCNTLIIDKRKELSVKYKKIIEGADNAVTISHELNSAMKYIQENEPDLIIVSDSIDEDLSEFCKKIRILTYNMRPIIIALSKSSEVDDKLKVLDSGADDFIGEPVNSEELKMRLKAHLRREYETNSDLKTMLPNRNYSMRAIKRIIASNTHWACMFVSIENFFDYKENYTELASDKLIQTYCAIINSSLGEKDYFGMLSSSEFLIITQPHKVEKVASFLTFAFDAVSVKFYSDEDVKRGYMIIQGDEYAGRRGEFVSTTIGVVTNEFSEYDDVKQLLASLRQAHSMAKKPCGSGYAIERPKISAADSIEARIYNNQILIFEKDEALSLLLATTLNLQGYEVVQTSDNPAVIIIDAGDDESMYGLKLCREIKAKGFLGTKIIVTSVFHDKELVLNAGADLYLPKPYELSALANSVRYFVNEVNN